MILFNIVFSVLFGYCHCEPTAKGLVYYPPYIDPYNDQNPCAQFAEWNLQEGKYAPPKQDLTTKECKGSFNNIPFVAPRFVVNSDREVVEDFAVDTNIYTNKNYNIQFTCKDQTGRVKSGLYFWVYLYRLSGIIKSYSYQTSMSWDTEGKLLFQPFENRAANISCRYYDSAKGYITAVRTWRLLFTKTPTILTPPTVEIFPCTGGYSRPTLSTSREVNVVVTSNRLEFSAFCPVVACQQNANTEFLQFVSCLLTSCP